MGNLGTQTDTLPGIDYRRLFILTGN